MTYMICKFMTVRVFFDSIKKITSNPIAKSIVKSVAPIAANLAAQQVKNFTGSDAASNITKSLINEGSKEMTGKGFNFNNIMKSKITKGIVKSVAPIAANLAAQQVKNFTGSDAASNITKSLINEGSKELNTLDLADHLQLLEVKLNQNLEEM